MKNQNYAEERFREMRHRMVQYQIKQRGVNEERVLNAFLKIPRHLFIPEQYWELAYQDTPLPIGYGQTISQPYIVALMTKLLELSVSEKVLEIGTGSGYQAAILSCLCKQVITIERISQLAEKARKVFQALKIRNVSLHQGDGSEGWLPESPYDAIVVTAGAPQVPQTLKHQLGNGGRLILPVGSRWRQELQLWKRNDQEFTVESIIPVVFVPLIGEQGWEEKPPGNELD